ncbi:TRAFAC clade GTPase domain-containing protein [Azospirillum sp. sgz301742]
MTRSVVLLGGPDSGKTNYVGRLWPALDEGKGRLKAAQQPKDITFVLEVADHLFSGNFAPRSQHTDERRDFEVVVADRLRDEEAAIVVPDIRGELWRNAVLDCEIAPDWMEELRRADGALLFVRVGSDQDVRPLDWVTSQRLLAKLGGAEEPGLATQVMLCELIRFLEVTLTERTDGSRPRLSVVVSAWDLVDAQKFAQGPKAHLEREYPLLAGRLVDIDRLDVRVFGLSVVGGDLKADAACRDELLDTGLDGHGWVALEDDSGTWTKDGDLTLPVAWVVGF